MLTVTLNSGMHVSYRDLFRGRSSSMPLCVAQRSAGGASNHLRGRCDEIQTLGQMLPGEGSPQAVINQARADDPEKVLAALKQEFE